MPLCFTSSLQKLGRLSAQRLHKVMVRIRGDLGSTEWKMGVCLLAMSRTRRYLKLGFSSLTEYAERALQLSGKKANLLLITARILEKLPLTSDAYQLSQLEWGKLRALQTLLTPETEAVWLEFALTHRTDEVVRAVACSPDAWKRQAAFRASCQEKPIATVEAVVEIVNQQKEVGLEPSDDAKGRGTESQEEGEVAREPTCCGRVAEGVDDGSLAATVVALASGVVGEAGKGAATLNEENQPSRVAAGGHGATPILGLAGESAPEITPLGGVGAAQPPSQERLPLTFPGLAPQFIRMTFELTPDEYAVYEAAERRVRAQKGRRVARGRVLAVIAESFLDAGTPKSRAKHQIVIHRSADSQQAWYQTERGSLPVSPDVLRQAEENRFDPVYVVDGAIPGERLGGRPPSPHAEAYADAEVQDDDAVAASSANAAGRDPSADCSANAAERNPSASGSANTEKNANIPEKSAHKESVNASVGDARSGDQDVVPPLGHGRPRRKSIPTGDLRALFIRADHRCERCGSASSSLHAHHQRPVCEGGGNDLATLELLCVFCHAGHHHSDFESKPHWAGARQKAMARIQKPRSSSDAPLGRGSGSPGSAMGSG